MAKLKILKTSFKHKDLVLPLLELPDPCPIHIDWDDEELSISVGQRDIQFDRKTGKVNGAGTMMR